MHIKCKNNVICFFTALFWHHDIIYQISNVSVVSTLLASGDSCRLLITFANSSDPDMDGQNVRPDLDPNHLTP